MDEEKMEVAAETETVESSTTDAEETAEKTEEITEVTETEDEISKSKAFSERLKAARKKDTEKISKLEEEQKRTAKEMALLRNALRAYGYDGTPEEVADALTAANKEITPEQAKAERLAQEKLIEDAVNNHPSVKAAHELIEQQRRTAVQTMLKEDLEEIRKLNPEINNIADLANLPEANVINALVKDGMRYADAYKTVRNLEKPKKSKVDTKEHLKGIGGADGEEEATLVEIPKSEREWYQKVFPNLSYPQLREKYNNILKRQKGE